MKFIDAAKDSLNPKFRRFLHLGAQLARDPFRKHFRCPVCKYRGPFIDANFVIAVYGSAQEDCICPSCGSYERQRLQRLVFEDLAKEIDFSTKKLLHFAPEPCGRNYFSNLFATYTTADLKTVTDFGVRVDLRLDLNKVDLPDAEYDVVIATHVIEHIQDDTAAISEIRRILRPGGFAVLPVPIVAPSTIEYGTANHQEFGHVRGCGLDYFNRYRGYFKSMRIYESRDFSEAFQLYFVQDRTRWPVPSAPLLKAISGHKHADYAPVCFV
jgi:SAM-dependent methyltransferase